MGSSHQRQAVVVVEGLGDILAKSVTRTSRRDAPSAPVIRVGPEQVAHGTLVRHLLYAVERPDVVERVDAGREAAVQAEDLVVDERGEGEVVEEVGEVLPHVGVAVLAEALIVESVHLRDLPGLVVAAEDCDALWVSDLESHEEGDGLD